MNKLLLIIVLAAAGPLFAQNVDIKGVDTSASGEGNTTITIEKNKKIEPTKVENKWETHDGQTDVEGEPGATTKDARTAWKTACDNWKKEFRADNKDNKILSLNCGTVSCDGDAGSKTCTSKATYKIKTRLDQ